MSEVSEDEGSDTSDIRFSVGHELRRRKHGVMEGETELRKLPCLERGCRRSAGRILAIGNQIIVEAAERRHRLPKPHRPRFNLLLLRSWLSRKKTLSDQSLS